MTTRVLISFFCDDRPGVIEDLSGTIDDHQGNWLESQLSRLGGQFAGVLQAQIPKANIEETHKSLAALTDKGITASMSVAQDAKPATTEKCHLTLLGPDRPGIVHEFTRALHSAGFNVLSMQTSVETAPMSGEPLFRAETRIELGANSRLDELEWKLDALADAMTLEIDLQSPD